MKKFKAERKPGSEVYWNPLQKHRAKAVKKVFSVIRKKRNRIEMELSDEEEDLRQLDERKQMFLKFTPSRRKIVKSPEGSGTSELRRQSHLTLAPK